MAERSYEYTEIKTRIIIRNDISDNWEGSTIVLEKGEPAIEYDAVNKTAKLKFGDGESTFSQLPFSTLTPSEVSSLISAVESVESSKVTTVITSGDGNVVTSGSISDDGTTLTLTKSESFVPVTGGTFTGDVTVSGDFTADNIKTTRNINITSTHKEGNDGDHDVYNRASINFINNGISINETPVKIESVYDVITEAEQKVRSSLDLTADFVSINDSISIGNDLIVVYEPITLLDNHFDYPSNIVTKGYVDNAISSTVSGIASAAGAMTFKGTVGTSGTVADIASISSPSTGDTYKIITATSLTSEQSFDGVAHDLTVGDLVVYASNKWVFVPSGNEDVTTVKVAGSGDTINVSTTAQTGALVLGTAAGVNTVSTVTDSATTVPTSSAVKTYVDTLENSLGTAATTDATAYATAAQGTLADNAMPKSGGTFTGDVTVSGELFTNNINASTSGTITIGTSDVIEEEWISTSQTKIVFCNSNDDKYNNGTATQAEINVDYEDSYGPGGNIHLSGISLSSDYFSIHANQIEFRYPPLIYDGYGPGMNGIEGVGVPATTASREYVQQTAMLKSGGTFTGAITLQGPPTENLHAATKKYVDDSVSSISTDSLIDGENILILNGGSATE